MKNTLAQEWEKFNLKAVPANAPPVQVSEMQLAFYAGAAALLTLQTKIAADASEVAGVALIEAWNLEINDFFMARLKG